MCTEKRGRGGQTQKGGGRFCLRSAVHYRGEMLATFKPGNAQETVLLEAASPLSALWKARMQEARQLVQATAGPQAPCVPMLWQIAGIPRTLVVTFGAWAVGECLPLAWLFFAQVETLTQGLVPAAGVERALCAEAWYEDQTPVPTPLVPFVNFAGVFEAVLAAAVPPEVWSGVADSESGAVGGRPEHPFVYEQPTAVLAPNGGLPVACTHQDTCTAMLAAAHEACAHLAWYLVYGMTGEDLAALTDRGGKRKWNGRFCGLWAAAVLAETFRIADDILSGRGQAPARARGFAFLLFAHVCEPPA